MKSFNSFQAAFEEVSIPDSETLVSRLETGDPNGMLELYALLWKTVGPLLHRSLGPVAALDQLHEIFIIVTTAVRQGRLRNRVCLVGFIRTVARRQVVDDVLQRSRSRRNAGIELSDSMGLLLSEDDRGPEVNLRRAEERQAAINAMKELAPDERNLLYRFYVLEHSKEQILADTQLTETQFRLAKSRAKARLVKLTTAHAKRTQCQIVARRAPVLQMPKPAPAVPLYPVLPASAVASYACA